MSENQAKEFGKYLRKAIKIVAAYEDKTTEQVMDNMRAAYPSLSEGAIKHYSKGNFPLNKSKIEDIVSFFAYTTYFSPSWLKDFMASTKYDFPAGFKNNILVSKAINRVTLETRKKPLNNLPPALYPQLLREEEFWGLIGRLLNNNHHILLYGTTGLGKTTLAHAVGNYFINERSDEFKAVLWISARSVTQGSRLVDPKEVTLDQACKRIIEVTEQYSLGHYGTELNNRVREFLNSTPILLIFDNFESVVTQEREKIAQWAQGITQASSIVFTSRKNYPELEKFVVSLSMPEMSYDVCNRFILLQFQKLGLYQYTVRDLPRFRNIIAESEGNPYALEVALAIMRFKGIGPEKFTEEYSNTEENLIQRLLNDSLELIASEQKKFGIKFGNVNIAAYILYIITLFPHSANSNAVYYILNKLMSSSSKNEDNESNHLLEYPIYFELLEKSSLIFTRTDRLEDTPRFEILPAAKNIIITKRKEWDRLDEAYDLLVKWYIEFTKSIGWSWNDIEKLDQIDTEKKTLISLLDWCSEKNRPWDVVELTDNIYYYFDVRSLYFDYEYVNWLGLNAALTLDSPEDIEIFKDRHIRHATTLAEQKAIFQARYLETASLLNNVQGAKGARDKLIDLHKEISQESWAYLRGTLSLAMYEWVTEEAVAQKLMKGREKLEDLFAKVKSLNNNEEFKGLDLLIGHWLSSALVWEMTLKPFQDLDNQDLDKLKNTLITQLEQAKENNYIRSYLDMVAYLIYLQLKFNGDTSFTQRVRMLEGTNNLLEILNSAERKFTQLKDKRHKAIVNLVQGCFYAENKEPYEAKRLLEEAREFFEKNGKRTRYEFEMADKEYQDFIKKLIIEDKDKGL